MNLARAAATSRAYRAGAGSVATINDEASVVAYIVARMPATYAVAAAVFKEMKEGGFAPKSLLDVGAGPGTASWAASEIWPELTEITMTDSNADFLRLAKRLAAHALANATFVASAVGEITLPRAELVAANFVLAEIAEAKQDDVVRRLWAAATDSLVLIEPGTPAGFARIRAARRLLIADGGHVLAPCTHDAACPIQGSDWCHFSQRLPRSRDHLKMKAASVPFEDERYSYVAVTRRPIARANLARIIAPPQESKAGLTLPLCTERGLQHAFVSRRQRDVHGMLRKARWGDTILSQDD